MNFVELMDAVGGGLAGAGLSMAGALLYFKKFKKQLVIDGAETNIYTLQSQEITRLAVLVKEMSQEIEQIKDDHKAEAESCHSTLRNLEKKLDEINNARHLQEQIDQLAREGKLERRKSHR